MQLKSKSSGTSNDWIPDNDAKNKNSPVERRLSTQKTRSITNAKLEKFGAVQQDIETDGWDFRMDDVFQDDNYQISTPTGSKSQHDDVKFVAKKRREEEIARKREERRQVYFLEYRCVNSTI